MLNVSLSVEGCILKVHPFEFMLKIWPENPNYCLVGASVKVHSHLPSIYHLANSHRTRKLVNLFYICVRKYALHEGIKAKPVRLKRICIVPCTFRCSLTSAPRYIFFWCTFINRCAILI